MSEDNRKFQIEDIIKIFSLIYFLLIISGLCYSYFFYKHFNLVITEYIDLSDALLLFLPLLANSFVITLIVLTLMVFMIRDTYINEHKYRKLFGEGIKKAMGGLMFLFIIVGAVLWAIGAILNKDLSFSLYGMIVIFIAFFVPYLLDLLFEVINSKVFNTIREVLYILIIVVTIVIWQSYNETIKVEKRSRLRDFTITFKDTTRPFQGDSNTYYLGRTKNYIFVYNFSNHSSRVINVSDVKEFITSKE